MPAPVWILYNCETEQTIEDLDGPGVLAQLKVYSSAQLASWFAWHEALDDWKPVLELPEFQSLKTEKKTARPPKPASRANLRLVDESTPQDPVAPKAASPTGSDDKGDDSIHIFWMADTPDGSPTPTSLDEMTREFRRLQGHDAPPVYSELPPVVLEPESEMLAAQAEVMPDPLGEPTDVVTPEPSEKDRRKYPRFEIRYRVIVRNDNLTFRTFSRNISLGGVALEMGVPEALLGSECQIYVGNPKTGENIRFSGKLVASRTDSKFFVFLKSSPESLTKLQKWVESHTAQPAARLPKKA